MKIEKISTKDKVYIFIDSNNGIFENIRWGQQLKQLLASKNIDYYFISNSNVHDKYFNELGVNFIKQDKKGFYNFLNQFYNFIFKSRQFHSKLLQKRTGISYIIISFEIVLIGVIFYVFYGFVTPSVDINIRPSHNIEDITYNYLFYNADNKNQNYGENTDMISIPFHRETKTLKKTSSIAVDNIRYKQSPSNGEVQIINTTEQSYSIVANTKLVTEEGILYRIKNWVKIPAANEGGSTKTTVKAEAMVVDENGEIIGKRGNIKKGKKLFIKELYESNTLEDVYAIAKEDFKGGTTDKEGTVTKDDINFLSGQLIDSVKTNKNEKLKDLLSDKKNKITLNFDDFIEINIKDISIDAEVGDNLSSIKGTITYDMSYNYVYWKDIKAAVMDYINDRSAKNSELINIDRNSLVFYELNKEGDYYTIPTSVDVVWGYNFKEDVNGIRDKITSSIVGDSIGTAKKKILSYDEIDWVSIDQTPPRYDTIPSIRSRINIVVDDK